MTRELIGRLRDPKRNDPRDAPEESNELPIEHFDTPYLVRELILRGLNSNGLDLTPAVEKVQLVELLLKAVR
jgi:hypothetical protein